MSSVSQRPTVIRSSPPSRKGVGSTSSLTCAHWIGRLSALSPARTLRCSDGTATRSARVNATGPCCQTGRSTPRTGQIGQFSDVSAARRLRPTASSGGRPKVSCRLWPTTPTGQGLLVLTASTYGNVLRFLPPLVMPEHLLAEGLEETFAGLGADQPEAPSEVVSTPA